jgi:hypothetical protein
LRANPGGIAMLKQVVIATLVLGTPAVALAQA